jgi:hypothetical protein
MESKNTNPARVLWQACTTGVISFLKNHRIIRYLVFFLGLIIFIVGLLSAIIWNVPIFSWLYGKDISPPCLAAGGYALGVWYMSRKQ